MKINTKRFLICLAIPLAVGGIAALLTRRSMEIFDVLAKPPLSPPAWLFPVAWTALYLLMGIASYLVLGADQSKLSIDQAIWTYGIQLAFNFLWPIFFFGGRLYLFAFVWLVILWLLILLTTLRFYRLSRAAAYMMIPYLLWVAFAGYLNLGIYLLN